MNNPVFRISQFYSDGVILRSGALQRCCGRLHRAVRKATARVSEEHVLLRILH